MLSTICNKRKKFGKVFVKEHREEESGSTKNVQSPRTEITTKSTISSRSEYNLFN
jgi:hypothetical protein